MIVNVCLETNAITMMNGVKQSVNVSSKSCSTQAASARSRV